MLQRLAIRNYAIIEQMEIRFAEGLTIITGETGAGKSILLGALGLIMGERAEGRVFLDESQKCVVEGVFEVGRYDLAAFFSANDLDYEPEIIIRRELTPAGKSRAFVNDTPVTLEVLRQLAAAVIDLHEQWDNLDIHQVSYQLRMVDALAENKTLLAGYQQAFRSYQADQRKLSTLRTRQEEALRESDYLVFQLEELSSANLTTGEQESLEKELSRLTHGEEIKKAAGLAGKMLSDSENDIVSQLKTVAQGLSSVARYHPDAATAKNNLEAILLDLNDIAAELERIEESTEYDPARIAEIQERVNSLNRLQNKHHVRSVEELIELQAGFQTRFDGIGDLSKEIALLEKNIEGQKGKLLVAATHLSERRKSVVGKFEENVHASLSQMAMTNARLQIQVEPLAELATTGRDDVKFLFSANKGGTLQPIKDVASGGELARLTLAIKSLVASSIPLPTLIFDEIDSGVSGDVALRMGNLLESLAKRHQVVCVTHTPQVAAKGQTHYFVFKEDSKEKTMAQVRKLDTSERIRAIAVMLSSDPPTAAAMQNAAELLR